MTNQQQKQITSKKQKVTIKASPEAAAMMEQLNQQPAPSQPEESLEESGTVQIEAAAHIAEVNDAALEVVLDNDGEIPLTGEIPAEIAETGENAPEIMTREQFFQWWFVNIFDIAAAATTLESLAIGEDDKKAAAAADVIYDICLETPWMHWMISPQTQTMQRIMVISAFVAPKYRMVKAEIAERKALKAAENSGNSENKAENPAQDGLVGDDIASGTAL